MCTTYSSIAYHPLFLEYDADDVGEPLQLLCEFQLSANGYVSLHMYEDAQYVYSNDGCILIAVLLRCTASSVAFWLTSLGICIRWIYSVRTSSLFPRVLLARDFNSILIYALLLQSLG